MQFAQQVVIAVSGISPFPISLSDERGYIIGASNPERIGSFHQPSIEVLASNDMVLYTEEKIKKMENVLPGVAVPLKFNVNKNIKTVGVLGIIGEPEKVKPYAKLVKKYVEMMWQDIFLKEIDDIETKILEAFMQYILLSVSIQTDKLSQYCEMLQIKMNSERFCIIIDIGNSLLDNLQEENTVISMDHKNLLLEKVKQAYGDNEEVICSFLNTEKIVCLQCVETKDNYAQTIEQFTKQSERLLRELKKYHITNIKIASGNVQPSLKSIHQSYFEAEKLLEYAREYNLTAEILNYYKWDVLLELLPHQIDNAYLNKLLSRIKPLLKDINYSELIKNFMVYCKNHLNVSKAAKELFIHRNTLIYRLHKLEKMLDLDLKHFEHCMLLYLVLKNIKKVS